MIPRRHDSSNRGDQAACAEPEPPRRALPWRELSEPEKRLWCAVKHCDTDPVKLCGDADPLKIATTCGADWGPERQVRADAIRTILEGRGPIERPRRVDLAGARITGKLDLEHMDIPCHIRFVGCSFDEEVVLEQVEASGIYLKNCHLPGIAATQLHTRHSLKMIKCTVSGPIVLLGARIDGQLGLRGSTFEKVEGGTTIDAAGMTVGVEMFCDDDFVSNGTVRLVGARIGGRLLCNNGRFLSDKGSALLADELIVGGSMLLAGRFRAEGEVSLVGARVEGQLLCQGDFINTSGFALKAVGLTVRDDVSLKAGFRAQGTVDFTNSRIGGRVDLTGGDFSSIGKVAINLTRSVIDQNMECDSGFNAHGAVELVDARIRGNLSCRGGIFHNPEQRAINAKRLRIHGSVYLSEMVAGDLASQFHAEGQVTISGARIGGSLHCKGKFQRGKRPSALTARGMTIKGSLYLEPELADGLVDLTGTTVSGNVNWSGTFSCSDGTAIEAGNMKVSQDLTVGKGASVTGKTVFDGSQVKGGWSFNNCEFKNGADVAISADKITADQDLALCEVAINGGISMIGAHIGKRLMLKDLACSGAETSINLQGTTVLGRLVLSSANKASGESANKASGEIDLAGAKVAELDDAYYEWPDKVRLDNFVYGWLSKEGNKSVKTRIDWADSSNKGAYSPQVYRQLASAYSTAGQHNEARKVLVAAEDAKYNAQEKSDKRWLRLVGRLTKTSLKYTVGYGYHPLLVLIYLAILVGPGGFVFETLHDNHQIVLASNLDGNPPDRGTATTATYAPYFSGWIYALDLLLPIISLGQRQIWIPTSGFAYLTTAFTIVGWVLATIVAVGLGTMLRRKRG